MFKVCFLLTLLLIPCLIQAYVKFNKSEKNETIKFQTFSFIQQQPAFFNVTGPVVELPINASSDGSNCTISYNLSRFDSNSAILENITNPHTITILDYSGSPCFFDTFANACKYFVQYREYLIKLGYPNPDTLVIVRNLPEKGAAYGYPFADFQGNFLTSIEDPPQPWLKLQMVDSDNSTINMNLIRDNLDALFEVTQEMGPWNELMMSLWFRGIVWLLMIIMIMALIISLYYLYISYLDGVLTINLKYVVYLLAFIDSIIHTVTMTMRYFTLASVTIMIVHALLITWAFHLLLYLWSVVMSRLQNSPFITIFRGVIVLSLSLYTFQKSFEMVVMFKRSLNETLLWKIVSVYMFPCGQFLLSISFFLVAIFFYRKMKTLGGTNESTADILKKLTAIAITGFFCYFFLALNNLLDSHNRSRDATLSAVGFLVYYTINVVRCIAILSIITLKEASLVKRDKSWLESRFSFIEEKISYFLGAKSSSTSSSSRTLQPSYTGVDSSISENSQTSLTQEKGKE